MSEVVQTAPEGVIVSPMVEIPNCPFHLDTLWRQAMEIQSHCKDVIVKDMSKSVEFNYCRHAEGQPLRQLLYNPYDVSTYGECLEEDWLDNTHLSVLTPYSFGQLCTKLNIPLRYLEKCEQANKFRLAEDNVNSWLHSNNKGILIRLYDNSIRGILGSKYTMFDAPDILEVISHNEFLTQLQVKGYVLDPTRLHLRLVSCEPLHIMGEDLFPGIIVDSSDVGKSSLRVQFFIYKQVCTNGLMLSVANSVLFVQRHVGLTSKEFSDGLQDSMAKFYKCASYAQNMIEKIKYKGFSDKGSRELLSHGSNKSLFSENSIDEILNIRDEHYPMTLWGLINAITEYAQRFTLERRMLFEEVAGQLLYTKI